MKAHEFIVKGGAHLLGEVVTLRTVGPDEVPAAPSEPYVIRCLEPACYQAKPLVRYAALTVANAAAEYHVAHTRHTVVVEQEREA